MAAENFIFTPNTFAGELASGYMATALLEANSVQRGLITVKPNVKKRLILRGADEDIVFQEPNCSFVGQGKSVVLDETYLDPVKYEVMKEYCWSDLVSTWESEQMTAGALNDSDPVTDLARFLEERMMKKVAIGNESLYWLGKGNIAGVSATFSSPYAGLLPKVIANGSTFKIPATIGQLAITGITNAGVVTVASTATLNNGDQVTLINTDGNQQYAGASISGQTFTINVINATTYSLGVALTGSTAATTGWSQFINQNNVTAVLSSVYAQIDEALRNDPDLVWYIPTHVGVAYMLSQNTSTNGAGGYIGTRTLDFLGVKMEPMNYFKPNSIMVAKKTNLFLAVDLISDENTVRTVDMRNTTNDELVRFKMAMRSDVNAKYFSEILWYSPFI